MDTHAFLSGMGGPGKEGAGQRRQSPRRLQQLAEAGDEPPGAAEHPAGLVQPASLHLLAALTRIQVEEGACARGQGAQLAVTLQFT